MLVKNLSVSSKLKRKEKERDMAEMQFAVEMGMGTYLKGEYYTKAACRAVHDALHRNFLTIWHAFDFPLERMIVKIRIGVTEPEKVNIDRVKEEAPAGCVSVEVVEGGARIDMLEHVTVVANAIVTVSYDVERKVQ